MFLVNVEEGADIRFPCVWKTLEPKVTNCSHYSKQANSSSCFRLNYSSYCHGNPSWALEWVSEQREPLSSNLIGKSEKKEGNCYVFHLFCNQRKPSAPIFHIVKYRNNDFLVCMQFSASLVKCWVLGEQKSSTGVLLKGSTVFTILSNAETKTTNRRGVGLCGKYQMNNYLPLSPFPSFVIESARALPRPKTFCKHTHTPPPSHPQDNPVSPWKCILNKPNYRRSWVQPGPC